MLKKIVMQKNLVFENLYMGINRVTYGTYGRKINPNYREAAVLTRTNMSLCITAIIF